MQDRFIYCYNKSVLRGKTLIEPRSKAQLIAELASQHKALDLRILEVSPSCDYADYFVLMSASSTRHTRALASALIEKIPNSGQQAEGYSKGEWILLDFEDVIIHIFHESARIYYNFDKLWGHVPGFELSAFIEAQKRIGKSAKSA